MDDDCGSLCISVEAYLELRTRTKKCSFAVYDLASVKRTDIHQTCGIRTIRADFGNARI